MLTISRPPPSFSTPPPITAVLPTTDVFTVRTMLPRSPEPMPLHVAPQFQMPPPARLPVPVTLLPEIVVFWIRATAVGEEPTWIALKMPPPPSRVLTLLLGTAQELQRTRV